MAPPPRLEVLYGWSLTHKLYIAMIFPQTSLPWYTSWQSTTGTHEKKMGSDDMMRYPPYQLYYDALSVSAEVSFK